MYFKIRDERFLKNPSFVASNCFMTIVPRYIFFYSVRVHSYIIFIFSTKGYRERVIKQIYGESTPAETHFPKNKKNLRVPEIQDARRYNFLDILYSWYPSLSLSNHVQSVLSHTTFMLKTPTTRISEHTTSVHISSTHVNAFPGDCGVCGSVAHLHTIHPSHTSTLTSPS